MINIHGKIKQILPLQTGVSKAGKEWKKQLFLIEQEQEFNPVVCIEAFGAEKIDKLNKFSEGDTVEMDCFVGSREWNGKYFTTIQAFRFNNKNAEVNNTQEFVTSDDNDVDLPF